MTIRKVSSLNSYLYCCPHETAGRGCSSNYYTCRLHCLYSTRPKHTAPLGTSRSPWPLPGGQCTGTQEVTQKLCPGPGLPGLLPNSWEKLTCSLTPKAMSPARQGASSLLGTLAQNMLTASPKWGGPPPQRPSEVSFHFPTALRGAL